MSVFRINKNDNYTVMSNNHLREKEMSLKAKGLLSLMLSLPKDWNYSISGLIKICKENETAIKSTLKELQQFGYLKITKLMPCKKDGRAKIQYIYDIFEQPQYNEKQEVENPPLEIQPVEKPVQLNTNNKITNNKINNIKVSKKERNSVTQNSETSLTEQRESFNEIIKAYSAGNKELEDKLKAFIQMRFRINKPITNQVLYLLLGKLEKYSKGNIIFKLAILDHSLAGGYSEIYPAKKHNINDYLEEYLPTNEYENDYYDYLNDDCFNKI